MKPAVLCLLLLSACEIEAARNYREYKLTWTCLSPGGCERAHQVILIERAEIINGSDFITFLNKGEMYFGQTAQMVPSDELPAGCFWLYALTLFTHDLGPSMFCRTSRGFELEIAIPDRDLATQSEWLVEGKE